MTSVRNYRCYGEEMILDERGREERGELVYLSCCSHLRLSAATSRVCSINVDSVFVDTQRDENAKRS